MNSDFDALNRILRAQLTAVNQQFVHILALREWGLTESAKKILQIDQVDFPVAMKIIDFLVAAGASPSLASESFTPGASEAEILAAEQNIEKRLRSVLADARLSDPRAARFVSAALAPRREYADWLTARLDAVERPARPAPAAVPDVATLFAHLLVLIEQSMVHAFVHWHKGDRADADAAWAASGAAMMQATEIVRRLASLGTVPVPRSAPSLKLSSDPDRARAYDRDLATAFARCAAKTTERRVDGVGDVCGRIADYAARLSAWDSGRAHPADAINPPAFRSFESTLTKFVRP